MRVESKRPHQLKGGEIGFWHDLKDRPVKPRYVKPTPAPPKIDALKLWREMNLSTLDESIHELAEELGVKYTSLCDLGAVWCHEYSSWSFPMRDGSGAIVGLRLRKRDGSKFSYPGSRQGVFFGGGSMHTAYLPEGPTDSAALSSIGVLAIGRPSCSGGVEEVIQTIRRMKICQAVIIADNDKDRHLAGHKFNPGYDGAKRLHDALPIPCCTISLPCKDAREFLQMGGTKQVLDSIVSTKVWKVPQ